MDNRKMACSIAAGFVSVALTASATEAFADPRATVVVGKRLDPEAQRRISYQDLNLAHRSDQISLKGRIFRTAGELCLDLNGYYEFTTCRSGAVSSTDDQFSAAVNRARRQMAGLPVGPVVAISMVAAAR